MLIHSGFLLCFIKLICIILIHMRWFWSSMGCFGSISHYLILWFFSNAFHFKMCHSAMLFKSLKPFIFFETWFVFLFHSFFNFNIFDSILIEFVQNSWSYIINHNVVSLLVIYVNLRGFWSKNVLFS